MIGLADRAGGLLYVLAIKGDFKRHQVALDSSKLSITQTADTLVINRFKTRSFIKICFVRLKIQKAWTVNFNPRHLVLRSRPIA